MGETENVVTQCYEALVVREHLPEEGALKLAWKDGAGRMDAWLEVGERAALAEGLSKHLRQNWAEFVQGTMGRLPAGAPASSWLHLFPMGREEHSTCPWAGSSSQRQGDDGMAAWAAWGQASSEPVMSQDIKKSLTPASRMQDPRWPHPWRRVTG